jgi:thiamine biosynthesis lipoprotein
LSLAHRALSTSGDAEQRIEIGGVARSHVIDPRAAPPALGLETRCLAIVVGPDGAVTDALATAAGVLGAARGTEVVASTFAGFEARIEEGPDEARTRRETPGFSRLPRVFPKDR